MYDARDRGYRSTESARFFGRNWGTGSTSTESIEPALLELDFDF